MFGTGLVLTTLFLIDSPFKTWFVSCDPENDTQKDKNLDDEFFTTRR